MDNEAQYLRQLDWFDPAKHQTTVTVVGAGGIGGPTVLALAKLGVGKIRVFDFDKVELHNQPNQVYGTLDIGLRKTYALNAMVERYADKSITCVTRRLRPSDKLSGIVIGAVDSMASRKTIWETVKKSSANVPLYIDGRIGGEVIRVMSARPGVKADCARYEASILPEYKVAPLKCTAAGIIDVSFVVASLIVRAFRLWVTEQERIPDLFYDHRNLRFLKG